MENEMVKSLENDVGQITTSMQETSHLLNNYFQSAFVVEPLDEMPNFRDRSQAKCNLNEATITHAAVQQKLEKLFETKSKGCDGTHPRVLRNCAAAISVPLTIIYRSSLSEGKVPKLWKLPNITPIFKTGSRRKRSNYRQISLTSVPCKIMESFIHERIMKHCYNNGLFSKAQHGFLPKRSCVSNLLEARDILTDAVHHGYSIDVIYTDFPKAFDEGHKNLLHKLKGYGLCGSLFR
nr:uncharacterized protein LOC124816214 [Hydra vulgaris]